MTAERQDMTPDGIVVQVGQVWQDCDPRMNRRRRTVTAIVGARAIVKADNSGRTSWLSIRRMKPGSTGYILVPTDQAGPAGGS